ncbi:MAG TPA: TetR/AcrR family transcriptional regulator [Ktedonobacterales bacterium]
MPRSEAENQRLRERQRANILDAAMGVFARSGPSASMSEIAEAAGVSQGLAYRYFASKEEIYYALIARAMQGGLPEAEIARMTSGGPWDRLEALLSRIVNARREHPEFFQLLYHVLGDDTAPAELRDQMRERGMYLAREMRTLIIEGQAAGEIVEGDSDQLVVALLAYLDGLTRFSLYDPQQFKEHFPAARIIMRLFKPDLDRLDEADERKQGDDV